MPQEMMQEEERAGFVCRKPPFSLGQLENKPRRHVNEAIHVLPVTRV